MRPLERGSVPTETNARSKKENKVYTSYGDAKDDLQARIGKCCSYCEMVLTNAACHVEHIHPKDLSQYSGMITSWDNFLLSCQHCNSIKGTMDVGVKLPYMPHLNNTFLLFNYLNGGLVILEAEKAAAYPRAKILLDMVGVNRRPGHPDYSSKDDRWQNRKETWEVAQRHLKKYQAGTSDTEIIIDLALAKGFFSVWMTVFQAYPVIRQALIDAFPGTASTCFDANTLPINRNGVDI